MGKTVQYKEIAKRHNGEKLAQREKRSNGFVCNGSGSGSTFTQAAKPKASATYVRASRQEAQVVEGVGVVACGALFRKDLRSNDGARSAGFSGTCVS